MNPLPKLDKLPRAPGRQRDNVTAWLLMLFGGELVALSTRWYRQTAEAVIAVPERGARLQSLARRLRRVRAGMIRNGETFESIAAITRDFIGDVTGPWGIEP